MKPTAGSSRAARFLTLWVEVALALALSTRGTFGATVAATPVPGSPASRPVAPSSKSKEVAGAAIFTRPTLVRVRITLPNRSLNALRRNPREYVPATVTLDGVALTNVAVRLKGAAGSFRPVDDQPALTVSFSKFVEGRRWNGLKRIALNNSVQDSTYLNEYLAGVMFRAAGVPATRVAWAQVELNGNSLGLYVLKEAFEKEFLEQHFAQTGGRLYDGGFCQDINEELELDLGAEPTDRTDLRRLFAASRDADPARRWQRLQTLLDVDRFVSYAVVSVFFADWDGYLLNRNNYRVYFNPADSRAVFIPHGTDQLFQRSGIGLFPGWNGVVAQGLLETPEGRRLYVERARTLLTNVFTVDRFTAEIRQVTEALRPSQPDFPERANLALGAARNRIAVLHRFRALRPESTNAPTVARSMEPVRPEAWRQQPFGAGRLEEADIQGRRTLRITATGNCTASFRSDVSLTRGKYRFEGRARAVGVVPLADQKGQGAGLRNSGFPGPRRNQLVGNTDWVQLQHDFVVEEDEALVALIAELRASRGKVDFDLDSLRVVPLPR